MTIRAVLARNIASMAVLLGITGSTVATSPASAQDFPTRPLRIVVPFPAGGSNDVAARIISEHLPSFLGQPVYVENKGGANGSIGTAEVARSAADGHTILVASDSSVTNLYNFKNAPDPAKELTPLIQISRQPVVLVVHPSLGAKSLAEFVALAKQQPGLRYGTGSGTGSPQYVVAEWLAQLASIKLEQVAYRGGGPLLNDLVGAHIKIATMGATPAIPFHQEKTLLLIAQSGAVRSPSLTDVPTFKEAGFSDLALSQWIGVFAPAGLPTPVAQKLNAALNKVLAIESVRAALLKSAQEPVGGTQLSFADVVRDDIEKYGRLKKQLEAK
jgi:tripartite-type tricarboxylate transporter receptor subunit TctC